jgi:hypothetical protein
LGVNFLDFAFDEHAIDGTSRLATGWDQAGHAVFTFFSLQIQWFQDEYSWK